MHSVTRTAAILCHLVWLWASGCASDAEGPPVGTGGMSNPPPTTYGGQSGGNQASGGASSAQAGASPLGGRTNTAQECAVCERAKACCLALAAVQFADPAPCLTLTTNCELFSGMPGEAILTACKTYITQRTSSGLPACQDQP